MDGVFMKKIIKIALCLVLFAASIWLADIWQDKKALQENLVRLHVVANSDSPEDQEIKLQVKDAIVAYLEPLVKQFPDKEQAMVYIADNLSEIEQVANSVLEDIGESDSATACLGLEMYNTRNYETFSLPAGVYDSLRIQIGEGKGKNWWCVVFPSLCLPATTQGFQDAAVSSGLSENLVDTLANGRNFRFFILDCIGKIEKIFFE